MTLSARPHNKTVTLSDLHAVVVPEDRGAPTEAEHAGERDRVAADALLAHGWFRVGAAVVGAIVQSAIIAALPGHGSIRRLLIATGAYLLFVALTTLVLRLRRAASPAFVSIVLAGDLAIIFAATALSTDPSHYERALFGTMVMIHVANFYFGRRQAWRVLAVGAAGYVLLLLWAARQSLAVSAVEELWTLGIGVMGTMLVVDQAGHVRRRLRTIVILFERAERGDFSQTYDEEADQRHDAITRVGRAYNRVRAQLASMVLSDPLTGCLNRRGFEQALAREISRASRAGNELALLLLDLDHFKLVNDTYGHPGGDDVLRGAGLLLLQTARGGDIVARIGGEEFAILLPATGAEGALRFAERLCDVVRTHPFAVASDAVPIRVTTSIGMACAAPRNTRDSTADASVLAQRADDALYAAKRSGRDRACAWSPELESVARTSGPTSMGDVLLAASIPE